MIGEFEHYLKILQLSKRNPDVEFLEELVLSHMINIPFENISKLLYRKTEQVNHLLPFNQYIAGIIQFHFGGTCYTNNYFFHQLLDYLGFNVKLCGADMNAPDVHLVIIVKIDETEFLVDVGYAAPFIRPIPCDFMADYVIRSGNNKYVLRPKEDSGRQRLIYYRNDAIHHGYFINPEPRNITEFSEIISNSFLPEATFMNSILLTKYDGKTFFTVNNMTYTEDTGKETVTKKLSSQTELLHTIQQIFRIPTHLVKVALEGMSLEQERPPK